MPSPFLSTAIKAARTAGNEISRVATRLDQLQVDNKAVNDFVTNADRDSEAVIVECLQQAYPTHAILTEEAGRIGPKNSDYLWIIDPIDGTLNFMHGTQFRLRFSTATKWSWGWFMTLRKTNSSTLKKVRVRS